MTSSYLLTHGSNKNVIYSINNIIIILRLKSNHQQEGSLGNFKVVDSILIYDKISLKFF